MTAVLSIFPTSAGFPPEFSSAVGTIAGYAGMFDPMVPMSTLATAVSLIFTIELLILTFKATKWLFAYIPFVGGRG